MYVPVLASAGLRIDDNEEIKSPDGFSCVLLVMVWSVLGRLQLRDNGHQQFRLAKGLDSQVPTVEFQDQCQCSLVSKPITGEVSNVDFCNSL